MPLSIAQQREGVLAEVDGGFPLDVAVIGILPRGSRILIAESYGDSITTQTGRVEVELPNGDVKWYFLKLAVGENGRQLCRGEHTATSLINALIPGMTPKAVAWGKYTFSPPDTFFFIREFYYLHMSLPDLSLPDPNEVAKRVVELHSQISPNGKFGFEVPTFDGLAPHADGWETSWRVFFTRLLRKSVETDAAANGDWHELSRAAEHLLQNIVPQLLDPLQEGPDPIKPRLIHGDLWAGNICQDVKTGEIMFLDVGSFYGHNELDLGMWRRSSPQNLGGWYLNEYTRIFHPSEPKEGFDDRNRLYSLKFDLNGSAGAPNEEGRNRAFNNILYLIEKYAPLEDLPKYDPEKGRSIAMEYWHDNE